MNKREHPLYLSFLDASASGNTSSLHLFKDPAFLSELDEEEKMKLASLFLKRATDEPNEENVTEASRYAEELSGEKSDVLLNISTVLYQFGVLQGHKESLLLALGKMVQIEEKNPEYFARDSKASHLWGNLLLALHRQNPDDSFLEQAIQKYQYALSIEGNKRALKEIYWDLGEAYLRLGERSKEQIDFKNACKAYGEAAKLGVSTPHFWLDYGAACFQLGSKLGSPDHIKESIQFFKSVILGIPKEREIAFTRAWVLYAHASKKLVELTHDFKELYEADRIFQETLSTIPEEASLWLSWGELFIHFGWYFRDLNLLDKGLEKLTGLKIAECDPLSLSALLAQGLAFLGILLEDLRLIVEAEKRLDTLISIGKNRLETHLAAGVVAYARGAYFSEIEAFYKANAYFEKAKTIDSSSIFVRHMLFESSMAVAELQQDKYYAKKAVFSAARATELAPFVPLFWNNWGIALLKLHLYGKRPSLLVEQAIEKFQKAVDLSDPPDLRGLFHYGVACDILGGIMNDEGSYEKAIELLNQVFEKIPDSLTVRHQLALAYLHHAELTGDIEPLYRSVDLFDSVVSQDNEDEAAYCGLGEATLTLSELIAEPNFKEQEKELKAKAEQAFLKAIELGNLEANYHLACLYSLSGLLEKSMEYLERAALSSLPSKEEILEDEWLDAVKESEGFRNFLNRCFPGGEYDSA